MCAASQFNAFPVFVLAVLTDLLFTFAEERRRDELSRLYLMSLYRGDLGVSYLRKPHA